MIDNHILDTLSERMKVVEDWTSKKRTKHRYFTR